MLGFKLNTEKKRSERETKTVCISLAAAAGDEYSRNRKCH